ncbi:MAG: membrane protein insertion efficiency factor YidD [Pirellulales bacterium]|nr:membrane protein insertion efficiency factor YidD [Pirellulales bacterium]
MNWVWRIFRRLPRFFLDLPRWSLIGAVKAYQWLISPWLGPRCRFQPTCSMYFIGCLQKYGAIRGSLRGLLRISRCHPWTAGGYDPP